MFRLLKKNKNTQPRKNHIIIRLVGFFVIGLILLFSFVMYNLAGVVVTDKKQIEIPKGYSIIQTSELLEDKGVIRSSLFFRAIAQYNNISIKAGTYIFKKSHSLLHVIERVSSADYGVDYLFITIPEGSTHNDIIKILKTKFSFSEADILKISNIPEGYLFPDTYSFLPTDSMDTVISTLIENFEEKYDKASQNPDINISEKEAVTMASIIEKEAGNNLEQKQIIAGILWKRINEGMLLQVDAPFVYERQKGSSQLSYADLETDSQYNTYTRTGLTPTAIGNPGYDSLYAAYHPIDSDYYFYLHASGGKIYYAKTYDGHLKNIRMYLR